MFTDMAIATEAAGKALDALLAHNELTFGDPEEDWDAILDDLVDDALEAATSSRLDAVDDGDPPLSPKLLELAGVPAAGEAEAG